MSRHIIGVVTLAFASGLLATASPALANEGQWKPDQIGELDARELAGLGLELSPEQLWNGSGDERDGGLLRAAVNLSGCSAAFISADGLIATNHHCSFGAIQAQSTVDHDYLSNGFLAATRADELEAEGKTIRVLRSVTDVTKEVRAEIDAAADPVEKSRAAEHVVKTLVKTCEESGPNLRCNVASFYNGSHYELFEYVDLLDIRLVYAPPKSVGEYGGEIDNWMWPRHTGDFSLLRAYVSPEGASAEFSETNVPYHPVQYLKVSPDGVAPGDFVAILGYPGRTNRYLSAAEVERNIAQALPMRVEFYGEWIDILEKHGAKDEAVAIKVAATKKSFANRHKNARGMIDGLAHMNLADKRRAEEAEMRTWASKPGRERHLAALDKIQSRSDERRATHARNFLLGNLSSGSKKLSIAISLVRRAREMKKPDLERRAGYMERDAARLRKRLQGRIRDYDQAVDIDLMASTVRRARDLPKGSPLPALAKLAAKQDPTAAASRLVSKSKLEDETLVLRLFDQHDEAKLRRSKDPMLKLAFELVKFIEEQEEQDRRTSGEALDTGPLYFEMLDAVREGPVYPDANSTLRFSYAEVKGYDKWDGEAQEPQTVLAEAVAKHTGEEPFDLPAAVREAAPAGKDTYWADPVLRDVPVCFLSNGDTTGGNSGSPVIDGKGRFVGLNFDRVWENIAGDFGYNTGHSRNITVDARYLLWTLDEVDDAAHLLEEMGVAEYRDQPRRQAPAAEASPAAPTGAASADGGGAGCAGTAADGDPSTQAPAAMFAGGLLLLGGVRLRRRRGERD